jgi:hypothetical protein
MHNSNIVGDGQLGKVVAQIADRVEGNIGKNSEYYKYY